MTFELVIVALLVVVLGLSGWTMVREHQARRPLPAPISGGAVGSDLVEIYSRLDDLMVAVNGLHDDVLRRPAGAAPLATAAPKPHRHQFMLTSEERNNKVLRKIYTCRVDTCPDTYIDEEPEPVLQRSAD
jgi:hypothetical protein